MTASLVGWSRAQFALTAIYHWLFVPLTLGLSVLCALMETRYYRTGDLGWYNERGELMFAGRRDGQIKLRGNRIELGEIENAARMVEGTENVCALFDAAKQEIVLFVETKGTLPPRQYNRELRKYIPAYMLPQRMVTMEKLPHNANDKIDRTALKKLLA